MATLMGAPVVLGELVGQRCFHGSVRPPISRCADQAHQSRRSPAGFSSLTSAVAGQATALVRGVHRGLYARDSIRHGSNPLFFAHR